MFIFYDFETSSRELLGQILSYSFIVTDTDLHPIEECNGLIKLNRTQLPELNALLVNRINILTHQDRGLSEYDSAKKIHCFLDQCIAKYGPCKLVGYNSNQFDLNFLRVILTRYGLNPYFKGQLGNLDMLHVAQHIAFLYPDRFPWIRTQTDKHSYYSFRLEDLAQECGLLSTEQRHDAREDVLLTISLAQAFESIFDFKISTFSPIYIHTSPSKKDPLGLSQEKARDFAPRDEAPKKHRLQYWAQLASLKKALLLLDLQRYADLQSSGAEITEADKLNCIRYINFNKHFMILEPITNHAACLDISTLALQDPFLKQLSKTPARYFELLNQNWDIDYRIHALGFQNIAILQDYIHRLFNDPSSYPTLLSSLLANRRNTEDNYLIQLFNRAYLNYHPQPKPEHTKKYTTPRYVTGTLHKHPKSHKSLSELEAEAKEKLHHPDTSATDKELTQAFLGYFYGFLDTHSLSTGT